MILKFLSLINLKYNIFNIIFNDIVCLNLYYKSEFHQQNFSDQLKNV
jgi:hypothetical protein